jgi:hypothetical protein
MHEPHVRYPHDPGPLLRAQTEPKRKEDPRPNDVVRPAWLRYTVLGMGDPDVRRIRADVANEGRHLFVCALGDTGFKQLVEAYYPDEVREAYAAQLPRHLRGDFEMGRLIVVNELFGAYCGEIDPRRIDEINRNARNVHSELKRSRAKGAHAQAIHNAKEAEDEVAIKDWSDWYEDAYNETLKFGVGKPRVSAVTHTP